MSNGKKMEIFMNKMFSISEIRDLVTKSSDLDELLLEYSELKTSDKFDFKTQIELLKVIYVNSMDYEFLSTASLIFAEFKIHSAVPLIVAKLLSGQFDDCGGTFLYCLFHLDKKYLGNQLRVLWTRNITWEMKQKLVIMKIYPEDLNLLID